MEENERKRGKKNTLVNFSPKGGGI